MEELQIVVFSLNNEVCGVESNQVFKIERYQKVRKLSDVPDFIEGLFELRGITLPVINLNKRFNLGSSEITKKSKIIISPVNEFLFGFMVNDVFEILKLTGDDIENAPEAFERTGKTNHLKKVGKKGDKVISILDMSKILSTEEFEMLKKMSEVTK
jgi:purine-binding chemotaxis protein CheW